MHEKPGLAIVTYTECDFTFSTHSLCARVTGRRHTWNTELSRLHFRSCKSLKQMLLSIYPAEHRFQADDSLTPVKDASYYIFTHGNDNGYNKAYCT